MIEAPSKPEEEGLRPFEAELLATWSPKATFEEDETDNAMLLPEESAVTVD